MSPGQAYDPDGPFLPQLKRIIGEANRLEAAGRVEEQRALLNALVEQIRKSPLAALGETMRRVDESMVGLEPAAFEMGVLGWTVPMWGPIPLVETIMNEVPADRLDELFLNTYRKKLWKRERALLKSVSAAQRLAKWHPLLKQAIKAYRRGDYLVVVPALLVIFEGAITTAADQATKRGGPRKAADRKLESLNAGMQRVAWVSLRGFASGMFVDHPFSNDPPVRLNRHWVLHGRDNPSWARLDCIKLLQALETLAVAGWRPEPTG